jgi:hypothetical protein
MNASNFQVNASSPPPINWATRPKPSSGNSVTHPMITMAHRLVPVSVDADHLADLQEGHLEEPASQPLKCELKDHVITGARHFEEVQRRLSQLQVQSSSRQSQPEEGCFDGGDPSSEIQMQDLMSDLSSLSVSTSSVPSHSLAARPAPVSTPGISPQVSPKKKRYYVILVGKCAGIYYDNW